MNALAPALSEGANDIVNLIFVPWGNAYVNTTKCGTADYSKQAMYCWIEQCGKNAAADDECFDESKKICQHGDEEVMFLCLSFSLSVTRKQESLSLSLSPPSNNAHIYTVQRESCRSLRSKVFTISIRICIFLDLLRES